MQSSSPEDAYFAVAKRVPVRMRFSIDQRKVHEFLANCGSADLMLEIRQVRIGDTEPAAAAGTGGGLNYGEGMVQMEGASMGSMDGGGYGSGAAALGPANFDLDIEVYGIVYLFNPVDLERLGLNQVTEDTELDTTVEDTSAEVPAVDAGQLPGAAGDAGTPADPAADAAADPAAPAADAPAAGDAGTPPAPPAGAPAGTPAGGQPNPGG